MTFAGEKKNEVILEKAKKRGDSKKIIDVEEQKISLVIFLLNDIYFAFHGSAVKTILPYEEITYVPGCRNYILGIINVRGDIESVLDLHIFLNLPGAEPTPRSRIVIAAGEHIQSGILVDTVEDVVDVPKSALKPPIATIDMSVKEFVDSDVWYNEKNVAVLDVGKIFAKIAV
jgi:purine-binding chemotaxis protein CheW